VYKQKLYILGRVNQIIDILATAFALWMGFFLWWLLYQVYPLPKEFIQDFMPFAFQLGFVIFVIPLLYELNGLYQNVGFRTRVDVLQILIKSHLIGLFVILAYLAYRRVPVSRSLVLGFVVCAGGITLLKELLIIEYLSRSRKLGRHFKNVVLVGYGEIAKKIINRIEHHTEWGFRLAGVVVPEFAKDEKRIHGLKVLGVYDEMGDVLRGGQYDQVVFAVQKKYIADAELALYACETQGMETWFITDFFKTSIARLSLGEFQKLPMMVFTTTPEYSWQQILKVIIDKVGALVGLTLTGLVFITTAILVKITSPGPVFFKQKRQGLRGKEFNLLKFRSMVSDAEQLKSNLSEMNEMDEIVFKIENDPRITKVGRFIRKYSIDELPQFINVLKGDMSLVGPRPMLTTEIDEFQEWQRRKLSVRPGLTCLWQISGRSDTTFREWMELDLEYIDNWSVFLDIKILFKTIPVVLFAKGAK
jgi:exopolysaccharide biosynthesis polyprenyl glycosylphosphotransferase